MVDAISAMSSISGMEQIIKVLKDTVVCTEVAQRMVQIELTAAGGPLKASHLLILFGAVVAAQGAVKAALTCAEQPVPGEAPPATETVAG